MKKIKLTCSLFSIIAFVIFNVDQVSAQCTWHWQLHDGFEYTTTVPDLVPGTTVHTVPQSFAVHSGTKSLYMNFVNTVAAGTLVYHRTIIVCPNTTIRLSAWLATSFSGTQCNVHLQIKDANNTVLSNTDSLKANYAPSWSNYQSGPIVPTTSTITFNLYTNIGGTAGGNDLSMDDFLVEQCNRLNLGSDTTICNTASDSLDAGMGFSSYLWNDNSTNPYMVASTTLPGTTSKTYFVTVTNTNGCSYMDTTKVTFTICTSIQDESSDNMFKVFPVPATDHIRIFGDENIKSVTLFNVVGEKVKDFYDMKNLFIGDLPKGYYILFAVTKSGVKMFDRILKE